MFEIDENNLPFVRTGQALLLLDLQNDFIDEAALLPVRNPPDFVENTIKMLPEFRASGHILWIRSMFEASRSFNESQGETESVITNKELRPKLPTEGHMSLAGRSHKSRNHKGKAPETESTNSSTAQAADLVVHDIRKEEEDSVEETFLTVPAGQKPTFVLATSPGTNFHSSVVAGADAKKDLFVQKTYYSAFKDGSLVQTLRAKFVMELYICGALTNISVFATAMDAARHGYAITIIEDCVGYRSKARHDEALRRLQELAGCELMTSTELIASLQAKARVQRAPNRHPRPQRPREKKDKVTGLEDLLTKLSVNPENNSAPSAGSTSTGTAKSVAEASKAPIAALDFDDTTESSHVELPVKAPERRERVKSKVKTRKRTSKSSSKDNTISEESGCPLIEKPLTPTSAIISPISIKTKQASPVAAETSTLENNYTLQHTADPEPRPIEDDSVEPSSDLTLSQYTDMENVTSRNDQFSLCEGDTSVIHNLLNDELEKGIFDKLRDEVRWQKMSHQGGDVPRLVVVQGEIADDGSIPIYRHPADESPPLLPFSPTVSLIKAEVERKVGHKVNHVLIQYYRDGTDYISEHSDKTLDIVPNTFIANVSLGAERTMVFRTKKPRKTDEAVNPIPAQPREAIRAPLPHNSMCKMGLVTNKRWLHSIRQDKRLTAEKTPEELAYGGGRISLTFRLIGTFLDKDQQKIWGQGAVGKTKRDAKTVINGKTPEAEELIWAFGDENHSPEFDWENTYGRGFDVLHMSSGPVLFLSRDEVADLRVKFILAEYRIAWTEGKISPQFNWKSGSSAKDSTEVPESIPVKFVDNDVSKSTIVGDFAILHYLDAIYGQLANIKKKTQTDLAKQYTRMYQSNELLKLWRAIPFDEKRFRRELELWESFAKDSTFIAGPTMSLADHAVWPILHNIENDRTDIDDMEHLSVYCSMMRTHDSAIKVLGPLKEGEPAVFKD